MKHFILSESEKKSVLSKHQKAGHTTSENMDSYLDEQDDESGKVDPDGDATIEVIETINLQKSKENPKYEKSLMNMEDDSETEGDTIYEIELDGDEDQPFEKGPRGMRAARTRSDYNPTARETELYGVFGKHGEDVDPTTIRYMRKNPKAILSRMADIYGVDKIQQWLDM
jgi:hypothetical protein